LVIIFFDILSLAATAFLLYRRTFNGAITAINTAIALQWFQNGMAVFALVEILAGI
jgi:hypothetical protein